MTSLEGLVGRFQPGPLAGADRMMNLLSQNQWRHPPTVWVAKSVDHCGRLARPSQPSAVDV